VRRLIAAEFRKLSTTRLWLWLLLASAALTALFASLAIAFDDEPDNATPPLWTPEGQHTLFSVGSGTRPLLAVLAAIALTGEFRHRTASATFLATLQRGRVVLARPSRPRSAPGPDRPAPRAVRIGPVMAVSIKPPGQPVGLPCGGDGAAPLQSFAMIGICLAKPIRLAATMIAPGIQSLPASTMIPKMSAASSPTVRSAVRHTRRLKSSLAVTVCLLGGSPLIVTPGDCARIRRTPRKRSAQPCRARQHPVCFSAANFATPATCRRRWLQPPLLQRAQGAVPAVPYPVPDVAVWETADVCGTKSRMRAGGLAC
jgi:hypothetical protein